MGKNRSNSALVHIKNKMEHKISKEKATGKYFIRGTDIEVPENKLCKKGQIPSRIGREHYNFAKPSDAQDLGSEWDHYAWSGDDY